MITRNAEFIKKQINSLQSRPTQCENTKAAIARLNNELLVVNGTVTDDMKKDEKIKSLEADNNLLRQELQAAQDKLAANKPHKKQVAKKSPAAKKKTAKA